MVGKRAGRLRTTAAAAATLLAAGCGAGSQPVPEEGAVTTSATAPASDAATAEATGSETTATTTGTTGTLPTTTPTTAAQTAEVPAAFQNIPEGDRKAFESIFTGLSIATGSKDIAQVEENFAAVKGAKPTGNFAELLSLTREYANILAGGKGSLNYYDEDSAFLRMRKIPNGGPEELKAHFAGETNSLWKESTSKDRRDVAMANLALAIRVKSETALPDLVVGMSNGPEGLPKPLNEAVESEEGKAILYLSEVISHAKDPSAPVPIKPDLTEARAIATLSYGLAVLGEAPAAVPTGGLQGDLVALAKNIAANNAQGNAEDIEAIAKANSVNPLDLQVFTYIFETLAGQSPAKKPETSNPIHNLLMDIADHQKSLAPANRLQADQELESILQQALEISKGLAKGKGQEDEQALAVSHLDEDRLIGVGVTANRQQAYVFSSNLDNRQGRAL